YSRFFNRVLSELGLVDVREPFKNLLTQGMVIKDGAKMSKSKGNVVDPNYLIERYGADTARLFCLFAAPPERDLDWSDQGVEGSYRFLQRVWRLVDEHKDILKNVTPADKLPDATAEEKPLIHKIHKTIMKVSEDLERFHLNTAIAGIMELVNLTYKFIEKGQLDERAEALLKGSVETILRLLYPFVPHITCELWQVLGRDTASIGASWPAWDNELVKEETIMIPVQINGRLRDTFEADRNLTEDAIKAIVFSLEKIQKHVEGKTIKKTIIIPNKLVNIVCG
ncbi:MAG: leuS, partial [Deltaproteobacteria bacterium]|nr:leuS [Deltaproteobacteria bacterium]